MLTKRQRKKNCQKCQQIASLREMEQKLLKKYFYYTFVETNVKSIGIRRKYQMFYQMVYLKVVSPGLLKQNIKDSLV